MFIFLFFLERPVVARNHGLAEATLRLPAGFSRDQKKAELGIAFAELYRTYGAGYFDVVVTANAILVGNTIRRYYLFFGQDFSGFKPREITLRKAKVVSSVGEALNLRTIFTVEEFAEQFRRGFPNSDVSVHSLVNIVYLVRRYMGDYSRQRQIGQHLRRLY